MGPDKSNNSLLSKVITQAIAIVGLVVVPGLVTLIAPRTTIKLRPGKYRPSAEITTHALLFVPVCLAHMDLLLDAESVVSESKYFKEDRQTNRKASTQSATGSVKLIGNPSDHLITSTPEDALLQADQIKAYIAKRAYEPLLITVEPPWMLTWLLGGIMTGLAALYCVGVVLGIARLCLMALLHGRQAPGIQPP
jgi:hypothetical protein